ncbi:Pyridoxal phosphate transferases superfamily protein [Perilla frutescens var. hirtella]|uniref:Pyridoxal phosphate transferases superfamily protein n=1 Tax=Perilla frutescens var. hirtella TaxID=608512 RepID=A0AAD4J4L6_PERFH|nr:Pyridoxal phosphate transferases superfamily protein [Perilla frutescens var. hirtella]
MGGRSRMWLYCVACIILGWISLNIADGEELKKQKLSWSRYAAAEAEAVASIDCSGHGRAYLDGLIVDGKPVCECNTCYGGSDCSNFQHDCSADANSGDPTFLEPFWMEHAGRSAVVVSGWHRMSYSFPDQSYISQQLENHIRTLHSIAKNAITEGKYIVYGTGSTQLLTAAVFALSINRSSPAPVVAKPPYYPVYRSQTDYFETARFRFDNTFLVTNTSDEVIEFVASPNNPDGNLRKSVFEGPNVKTIYDHAYYWPHFSAIPAPADEDLMIFTLSKITGHAGSRFGWAIVRDRTVYENMLNYISFAELGTSRETQLRTLQLLRTIIRGKNDGKEIFNFAYNSMRQRWDKLNQILSSSNRFQIQEIPYQFCSFFDQIRGPSPAYAWVKCVREEDSNCTAVLDAAKIIGREGRLFGSDDHYVRLSLIRRQDDFDLLLRRLTHLLLTE